jgi:RNA polymerase sigma factor (sigma-70 family)
MADSREAIFTEHRPQLFSIAYRMLGSAADAEDIVQDCYLRWRNVADADVQAPRQYLASIVTRLCINHLQSARVRREHTGILQHAQKLVGEQRVAIMDQVVLLQRYGSDVTFSFTILWRSRSSRNMARRCAGERSTTTPPSCLHLVRNTSPELFDPRNEAGYEVTATTE